MADSDRIILFPGLGADARMFGPQVGAIPNLETPEWIPHVPRESLRQYAVRLAKTLDIRGPVVLGGVSMGGMVALEIARLVPTRCVILIASARHPSAVNHLLPLSERLSRVVPSIIVDKGRILAPMFLGRGGFVPAGQRRILAAMAREMPVSFLRWASRAIIEWEGCAEPGVPVYHIHGDSDWVFPLRGIKPDRIVRGGVHVLNLSHPREVNEFIMVAAGRATQSSRQSPGPRTCSE